jgi:hypothetical protein
VSSVVQPAAVVALANARLRDAREGLERKLDASTVNSVSGGVGRSTFGNTERRVLGLVREAADILGGRDPVPLPATSPLATGPSRYAVLGSAGFEIPTYADLFAAGGTWRSDVMRRGNRDPDVSLVSVPTAAFANAFGALNAAEADVVARKRGEAVTFGLLGAIAHGVVMGPVGRGAQARRSTQEWNRDVPGAFVAAADARILARLVGTADPVAAWRSWWPTPEEAKPYWAHYLAAIDATWKLGAVPASAKGLSRFEKDFPDGAALDAARVEAGYRRMLSELQPWGAGAWFGVLTPLLLVPPLATLLTRALPHAERFNTSKALTDRSFSELLTVANGLGAVTPFIYSMVMWANVPDHSGPFWNALVLFLARLGLVIGWIPTIGTETHDPSPVARWLLTGGLLGADVYALIRALVAAGGRQPGASAVFALQTVPAMTSVAAVAQASLVKAVVALAGEGDEEVASWTTWAVTTLGLWLGVGLPLAFELQGTSWLSWFRRRPNGALGDAAAQFGGRNEPTAPAQVFDDSTLWHLPAVPNPAPADLRYPSGTRPLVRLWWTGSGDLEVAHDGHLIRLRNGAVDKPVPVGPGVRTTASIVAALTAAFPTDLHAEIADASDTSDPDPDYDLPWPATLADPGDAKSTVAEHDAAKDTFQKVGTSKAKAYLIRHTPRATLSSAFSLTGPATSALRGARVVPQAGLGDVDDTALGTAADLALLLCLGASSRLRTVTPAQPNPIAPIGHPVPPAPAPLAVLAPVSQVFRNWNLDERRVNEWREIVTGSAAPEAPAVGPPLAPGVPDGRAVALAMGWVPLWRAWLRLAGDPLADANAAVIASYAPTVTAHDGRTFRPTNAELSAGVRFLLDLPA